MPTVMIKCPKTGQAVPTDIVVPEQVFEAIQLVNNTLGNCPECGENHVWSKEDAFLEGNG